MPRVKQLRFECFYTGVGIGVKVCNREVAFCVLVPGTQLRLECIYTGVGWGGEGL